MTKAGVIVPLYLTIVSGCASFDTTDTVIDKKENPVAAVETEAAPVSDSVATAAVKQAPVSEPRRLASDDIRRWQTRLREVGFDPGPIDGVAGAKTKSAFKRFESSCGQVRGLLNANAKVVQLNTSAVRKETLLLQTQLRDAGFNPGPVDGVFGSRTKTLLVQLQNGCPTTKEFAAFFDRSDGAVSDSTVGAQLPQKPITALSMASQVRMEPAKQVAAPVPVRPQEDIRILQLRLRDAGFDPGPFDGVMGPKTRLAMQQFQASQRAGKTKSVLMLGTNGQY